METVDLKRPSELSVARIGYRRDVPPNYARPPLAAFMDFAAKQGVPPLRYSFEDLEEERQTANQLKS